MTLPPDLPILKEFVFDHLGLESGPVVPEAESAEYGACSFQLNRLAVRFRTAKITPTKTGQFVTLWKRTEAGPIAPYEEADEIDFVLGEYPKRGAFRAFCIS
jgi:hypothetical protein